jgi:hypothetical protein
MVFSSCPSTTAGAIPSIISTPQVSTSSSQLHPPLQAPSLPVQPPPQHSQHPMILGLEIISKNQSRNSAFTLLNQSSIKQNLPAYLKPLQIQTVVLLCLRNMML